MLKIEKRMFDCLEEMEEIIDNAKADLEIALDTSRNWTLRHDARRSNS